MHIIKRHVARGMALALEQKTPNLMRQGFQVNATMGLLSAM
jgi:hypothetical protein